MFILIGEHASFQQIVAVNLAVILANKAGPNFLKILVTTTLDLVLSYLEMFAINCKMATRNHSLENLSL